MDTKLKKICQTCGQGHIGFGKDAKSSDMGTFWNCVCGSTMFVPSESIMKEMKGFKNANWRIIKKSA